MLPLSEERGPVTLVCSHVASDQGLTMTLPRSITRSASSVGRAEAVATAMLTVQTPGAGFIDLTSDVAEFLAGIAATEGALTVFVRHTSASLTIQENADPSVLVDLM